MVFIHTVEKALIPKSLTCVNMIPSSCLELLGYVMNKNLSFKILFRKLNYFMFLLT